MFDDLMQITSLNRGRIVERWNLDGRIDVLWLYHMCNNTVGIPGPAAEKTLLMIMETY